MMLELRIVALLESASVPGHYTLVLEEPVSRRRLPLTIAATEAQAIAMPLEQLVPARPLTHDLLQAVLHTLGATLEQVHLHYESDLFRAQLYLRDATGQAHPLDARPSDAVALAVRTSTLLYTTEEVLAQAAFVPTEPPRPIDAYLGHSLPELEQLLADTLHKQDFEQAARIRDALRRRRLK